MNEAQVRHKAADLEQELGIVTKNYERLQRQLEKLGKLELENAKLREQLRTVRDGLLEKYSFELSVFNNYAEQSIDYHLTWKMNDYEINNIGRYPKMIGALIDSISQAVVEDFVNHPMGSKETTRARRLRIK